jgi:very-long-chain enoyl-CoA reductase
MLANFRKENLLHQINQVDQNHNHDNDDDDPFHVIPFGFLFDYVSCPNYFFEILTWIGFNLFTMTFWGIIFMLAGDEQMMMMMILFFLTGSYQMSTWAISKHKRYRKINTANLKKNENNDDSFSGRKILIPFIW